VRATEPVAAAAGQSGPPVAARPEQSRARYPDSSGYIKRDGVRMQIPYLARHCRVLTFDGRGNGRSDRPETEYGKRSSPLRMRPA
jgi:pimeloyl-ACP methyl ester carboxylesterase